MLCTRSRKRHPMMDTYKYSHSAVGSFSSDPQKTLKIIKQNKGLHHRAFPHLTPIQASHQMAAWSASNLESSLPASSRSFLAFIRM